jgi:hypothetical protein
MEGWYQNWFQINSFWYCGLDSCGSGQWLAAGCCEHGNEPLVSIKIGGLGPDSCSRGPRFGFWLQHRLSWLRIVVILTPCRECWDSTSFRPRSLLPAHQCPKIRRCSVVMWSVPWRRLMTRRADIRFGAEVSVGNTEKNSANNYKVTDGQFCFLMGRRTVTLLVFGKLGDL